MSGPTTTSPATKQADKIKSLLASYYESDGEQNGTRYGSIVCHVVAEYYE